MMHTQPVDILEDLVDRLTVKFPEMGPFGVVAHDPLLQQLRESISSSTGRTHRMAVPLAERSPLNIAAFDLYEDLDGRIAVLAGDAQGRPEDRLRAWHLAFEASRHLGEVTEVEWLTMVALVGDWVRRIDAMFDPPLQREILAACPMCSVRHILSTQGLQQSALYAEYRRGYALVARCRACNERWTGEAQLIALARTIDADVDVIALAEFRG